MYYSGLKPLPYDIISIQSQVIYGTVGNNAAVPAFTRQGLRVCVVPTVLFSNTPHYPTKSGAAIPTDWFAGFLKDLELRGVLDSAKAIVLGYLGGAEQAEILVDWLKMVAEKYPHIHIGIDPVLGDHDSGLYVKPELAACYRDSLSACASLITPNHFELEFLSEQKSQTEEEVIASARKLIGGKTHTVIITSSPSDDKNRVCNLIVTKDKVEKTSHPIIQSGVKGTGDTFHATLTAALLKGKALCDAVQEGGDYVVLALQNTVLHGTGELYPLNP